jgi:hypothetical protein
MKLLAFLLPLGVLAGGAITVAAASPAATRSICHRTSSARTPYVKVNVSSSALRTHLRHAADIVPAPRGACPRTRLTATRGGRAFSVVLTGEAESTAGDPVGTGTATLRLRAGQGQVCYRLAVENLPPAVAAHIHRARVGAAGNVVVPLRTPNRAGSASGCATASRSVVASMLRSPAGFYVNVHTSEFPAGAIRGQLTGTSAASRGFVVAVPLRGTTEPNASGTAVVRIRQSAGLVCYRLQVANVTLPTVAAHIHRGGVGVNGPVVVPFTAPGANGESSGCQEAQAALIGEIVGNPAGFYVNVHTREHPAGAIRAQLG